MSPPPLGLGPVAFCHPRHPIVTPLAPLFFFKFWLAALARLLKTQLSDMGLVACVQERCDASARRLSHTGQSPQET